VRTSPAAFVSTSAVIEAPGEHAEPPEVISVTEAVHPDELIRRLRSALGRGGFRLDLQVDPSEPWPSPVAIAAANDPATEPSTIAARISDKSSVVILAGPGVVARHAVPGLHALATKLGAGVLNTWGAKGVFHWRSRHHWATVGLQRDDFSLGGLDQADLIIATGVDEREAPAEAWAGHPHVVVPPEALSELAEAVSARTVSPEMPPLRGRLAGVTQSAWDITSAPLLPSRVTLHYARQLAGGGFLAADAGGAGFWVARTFATTALGLVSVPAETRPGWAAACVTVARVADPLRPALAVVSSTVDEGTEAVLDFARANGISLGIEVWSAAGTCVDASTHEERLPTLASASGGGVATLATDETQLDQFVKAAGPVRSWPTPPPEA
jgi:hypothetical protein